MAKSKIDWTDVVWNPVTGCTKISAGCQNCYAKETTKRMLSFGQDKYEYGFEKVVCHSDVLSYPLTLKKTQKIFVNSMSDVFHQDVSDDFIKAIFEIMNRAHWHYFQVLTKRTDRLVELSNKVYWSDNIWMGVTVEDADNIYRIDELRKTGAKIKFLSIEPLIGRLGELDLSDIDWVIVGGESGSNARPMEEAWALEIKDQCVAEGIPFFFKQWGSCAKRKDKILDGREWKEYPL